jgi:hypothetical protein
MTSLESNIRRNASEGARVSFHRTADGFLAASVEHLAFLALPSKAGGLSIATASSLRAPPEQWKSTDFYGVDRHVDDEAAFRGHVLEIAEHRRELAGLDRREITPLASTPWGVAQCSDIYAEGVVFHATASHGGFHIDEERNAIVAPAYRNSGGWYEEDCEWAKVAASFPHLFTAYERRCADETLRHYEPDAYEKVNAVTLKAGESHTKDGRQFRMDHAADWIVISAINSRQRPGFVECVATIGGDRRSAIERRFLVPIREYAAGLHGFVIDAARHEPYDGPSSFIGWTDACSLRWPSTP